MRKIPVWFACAAALAIPASAMSAPNPKSQAQASRLQTPVKPTFVQTVQLFLFGNLDTGQPFEECGEEDALNFPGHSEDATGSAFHEDGTAGQHYAGEQPQNSKNPKSVSQYDTACAHAQSPQ